MVPRKVNIPSKALGSMKIRVILLLTSLSVTMAANASDVSLLHKHLFTDYNKHVLPLLNQSDMVTITTECRLISINNFDEISGQLDVTMAFLFTWTEERMTWSPADYGGTSSITVSPADIWRPQLYILQSFRSMQDVCDNPLYPRIRYDGYLMWSPGTVLKLVCSINVRYFPFDEQTCQFMISGWSYLNTEMELVSSKPTFNLQLLSDNSQWEVVTTGVKKELEDFEQPVPSLFLEMVLRRRSEFFLLYMVVPIIFLGLINNLVFLMPVTSGERMSVAVTVFLSFIVYMEMINDAVPPSSKPVALIYCYVIFLLVYSSTIMTLCIISLCIHDRKGPLSQSMKALARYLGCKCGRKNFVMPRVESYDIPKQKHNTDHDSNATGDDFSEIKEKHEEEEITWSEMGELFDRYCVVSLYAVYILVTTVIFVHLSQHI